MYEVLWNTILPERDKQRLLDGETIEAGFDRKVMLDAAFIAQLRENDIRKRDFLSLRENTLIINAGQDEIVSPTVVEKFAEDNHIRLVCLDKADHRITDPALMNEAVKTALNFFTV